jgi:adenosylcobinamide-GDP ribazoletransferase
MRALRTELVAAFMLLTALPIRRLGPTCSQHTPDAVWAYPFVGATIGAIGAAAYAMCIWIGLPAALAAVCSLCVMVIATGGLHEDALADTADSFGSRSRARKLEIMRDSHIGTFGVLALVLTLAARGTAIASIAIPWNVAVAQIVSGTLGRGAMLMLLLFLTPARQDGLGAALGTTAKIRAGTGLVLAAAISLFLVPIVFALCVTAAATMVGFCIIGIAWRQIGGYTGDVLGATEVVVESATLSMFAAAGTINVQ